MRVLSCARVLGARKGRVGVSGVGDAERMGCLWEGRSAATTVTPWVAMFRVLQGWSLRCQAHRYTRAARATDLGDQAGRGPDQIGPKST